MKRDRVYQYSPGDGFSKLLISVTPIAPEDIRSPESSETRGSLENLNEIVNMNQAQKLLPEPNPGMNSPPDQLHVP